VTANPRARRDALYAVYAFCRTVDDIADQGIVYRRASGRHMRFEVTIPASVDEVWAALTTHDGVVTWLWRDARVELRPGGDWIVLYPGGKTGGGTIISFEPKQRLTLAAMAPEQFPTVRERRTTAVFELEAASPSTTRVLLTQTGWQDGAEWDAAYDYLSRGNAILLEQLHRRFVSGPIDWSNMK
jgi:uncharacterized protein YndB with AHSA1/START domain